MGSSMAFSNDEVEHMHRFVVNLQWWLVSTMEEVGIKDDSH